MATAPPRQVLRMDAGWRFHLGDVPSPVPNTHIAAYMNHKAGWARGAARKNFDDTDWRVLDVPHDWSVEQVRNLDEHVDASFLPRGVAWYRRHFTLKESDAGRYVALRFDGVATHCTVYVNGHLVHRHFSGYTPFTIDVSDLVTTGDEQPNVVAVRVDATYMEGWWYEGAGIYRHVWLIKGHPLHLAPDGIFVEPRKRENDWAVAVNMTLENTSYADATCDIVTEILDPFGKLVMSSLTSNRVPARGSRLTWDMHWIPDPLLWSCASPNLYAVRIVVRLGDQVVEDQLTRFGCRTIRFDPAHGFFLNEEPFKLKGTCNHQDHAGIGVALPDSIHEFRVRRLKEMGCNAYRCAHHPAAPELLDACDRLGMLVMDENRTLGSSPEVIAQLDAMVRRDRNHPSVILWSICNEEPIQTTPVSGNIARAMVAAVKRLDPSRPVTAGVSGGVLNDGCIGDALDVMGINYQLAEHDAYHAKHPDKPLVAAETHCVVSTRGVYETSAERLTFASYDEDKQPWGETARQTWRFVSSRPFVAGLFAWTGFDYRGEPSPHGWPCVNSHTGLMDTCGFAKDGFHLHRAYFTSEPFVHVLPHWNWAGRDGQPIRVKAYTNAEDVELFLNGESLGRKHVDPSEMVEWPVPYRPGQLTVVAYRAGKAVAEAVVETTDAPVAVGLEVHPSFPSTAIPADGEFALPVTAFAFDDSGRRVPTANARLTFDLTGPGRIIGVGNGDPTCHEPDKGTSRSLFNGLAQVIVQTGTSAGRIMLRARSPGLSDALLAFDSVPAPPGAAVPPARPRYFVTDWRMSPVSIDRPDVTQMIAGSDMNTWQRVQPGSAATAGPGYVVFRATLTPPKVAQARGGRIVFNEVCGRGEVFLNGSPVAVRAEPVPAALTLTFGATDQPLTVCLLLQSDATPAGITRAAELIPDACATS